jgi:hypothetical protein
VSPVVKILAGIPCELDLNPVIFSDEGSVASQGNPDVLAVSGLR